MFRRRRVRASKCLVFKCLNFNELSGTCCSLLTLVELKGFEQLQNYLQSLLIH